MSTQKRNEYLDAASSSDNESVGYDSEQEAAADSRTAGLASHRTKRQKLSATPSDDEEEEDDVDKPSNQGPHLDPATETFPTDPLSAQPPHKAPASNPSPPPKSLRKKTPKPGVVYLSRIPPYMPPRLVQHHLSPHGPITNIFLTPEPPSQRTQRLSRNPSANRKRTYTDGWIEFRSRRHARACADAINGRTVGGKKGGWYRDDVWCAKYLKGFGWGDLMEGVRREGREREERVRVGVRREGREREAFLRGVEMGGRRRGKSKAAPGDGSGKAKEGKEEGGVVDGMVNDKGREGGRGEQRRFKQRDVKGIEKTGGGQSDEVTRVLSKIF